MRRLTKGQRKRVRKITTGSTKADKISKKTRGSDRRWGGRILKGPR